MCWNQLLNESHFLRMSSRPCFSRKAIMLRNFSAATFISLLNPIKNRKSHTSLCGPVPTTRERGRSCSSSLSIAWNWTPKFENQQRSFHFWRNKQAQGTFSLLLAISCGIGTFMLRLLTWAPRGPRFASNGVFETIYLLIQFDTRMLLSCSWSTYDQAVMTTYLKKTQER